MVYCEGVEVDSKLGKYIQAFRCDRPDEWTMDEFIRIAEDMHKEINRLRESEKDAARYRWLKEANANLESSVMIASGLDDDDLIVLIDDVDFYVDQAMKEKGDE